MKLSAPIYRLKRRARLLSRDQGIPLNQALDRIAREEGYRRWSLLAAKLSASAPSRVLLTHLGPGDLVLLGARPGHGKTMMGLELIAEAIRSGRNGVFFTLEYNDSDVLHQFRRLGSDVTAWGERFVCDVSDDISADYVIARLTSAPAGTVVVIDYLQLLDQKRENPDLTSQVRSLRAFARDTGLSIVCISQVDRSFDASTKTCPGLEDVRLPNPVDLTMFNKTCFLHDGEVRIAATG